MSTPVPALVASLVLVACVGEKDGATPADDSDPPTDSDGDTATDDPEPDTDGGDAPAPTPLDEAPLTIIGASASAESGMGLANAGDFDGDGRTDLLIGARGDHTAGQDAGAAHLVLGATLQGWSGTASLADADLTLTGEHAFDKVGYNVAGLGDVDGDGAADLILGIFEDSTSAYAAGAAALVLGITAAGSTDDLDLREAGLTLTGVEESDAAGWSVAGGGDVDGDGLSDLLVGAVYATGSDGQRGAAYLVLGASASAWLGEVSLADADLVVEGTGLGSAVVVSGDVDGDGLADPLIGSRYASTSAAYAGSVYLLLSASLGDARGAMSIEAADAEVTGTYEEQQVGIYVADAEDVDADGLTDVLIGDPDESSWRQNGGVVWLVTGASWTAGLGTMSLDDADASLYGSGESDHAGFALAGLGDLDADGRGEVLVAAPLRTNASSYDGASHLLAGSQL